MSLFPNNNECDICGGPLDPEDVAIHLCKYCQGMQFDEWMNDK